MDIEKQIAYWREGSVSNLESAELLISKGKVLEGLFFCHLALEKILKAHVVKTTRAIPPRIHNLAGLRQAAKLEIEDPQRLFLGEINDFALEARYPFPYKDLPSQPRGEKLLQKTKEIHQWLMNRL